MLLRVVWLLVGGTALVTAPGGRPAAHAPAHPSFRSSVADRSQRPPRPAQRLDPHPPSRIDVVGRGGTTIRLALTPEELPRPEEYAVEHRARGLLLSAHDTQGAYWAVHALATRLGGARRVDDG